MLLLLLILEELPAEGAVDPVRSANTALSNSTPVLGGCEGGGARENSSCTAGGLQSDTTYEIRPAWAIACV